MYSKSTPSRILSLLLAAFVLFSPGGIMAQCTDIVISGYAEGSSNNKYIELYNGTGTNIDLSSYAVRVYNNGNTNSSSISLDAVILADGDYYLIAHSSGVLTPLAIDQTETLSWNGDDAIQLWNGTAEVDRIGDIGTDPGAQWVGTVCTQGTGEGTIIKKNSATGCDVYAGNDFAAAIDGIYDCYGQNDISAFNNFGHQVTFQVDASNITVAADGMHLAGSFNGMIGQNMVDMGNGIWALSIALDPDTDYTYEFQNGLGGSEPTLADRTVSVGTADQILPVVCFDLTGICAASVDVTFQVDMSNETIAADGVFIAGSFNGYNGQAMVDQGGGIWAITLQIPENSTENYKFQNGLNNWEPGNDLAACGMDNGFGSFNRTLTTTTVDLVEDLVCYNSCTTCVAQVAVTFQVDMSNVPFANSAFLAGSFNGWNGVEMTDLGGGIYEITIMVDENSTLLYKFQNGEGNAEIGLDLAACGAADGLGGFNREFMVGTTDVTIEVVAFESCEDGCIPVAGEVVVDATYCIGSPVAVGIDFGAETDPNPTVSLPTSVMITEISINDPGGDDFEFLEIQGPAGFDLSTYSVVVIGDGSGGICDVISLTGQSIQEDNVFWVAEPIFPSGTPNMLDNLNFENSDNLTFFLVENFTGSNGDDLDTDNDGVLDTTPWTAIISEVSIIEPGTGDMIYSSVVVGPDGTFAPGNIIFDGTDWLIGAFDNSQNTPGEFNVNIPYSITYLAVVGDDIVATSNGDVFAPYAAEFDGLTEPNYCIHTVSYKGTHDEFAAEGIATISALEAAITAETFCAELSSCAPIVASMDDGLMACNDNVQISLSPDCLTEVTPDMIMEGELPCPNYFTIEIKDGGNEVIASSPFVSSDNIGETLTVVVTSNSTGNSCWSTISVEDKLGPIGEDQVFEIVCDEDASSVPFPVFVDNCDPNPSVTLISEVTTGAICSGDLQIERMFVASDNQGNESNVVTQVITVSRLDIDFPAGDTEIDCDDYELNSNLVDPSSTGYPFGDNADACGFAFSYQDEEVTSCGSSFKIVRTWTVLDWCSGLLVTIDADGNDNVQVIKIIDDEAPIISSEDVTVSANVSGAHPQPCSSTDFIAAPEVTDNCNTTSIRIFTPVGEVNYVYDNAGNVLGGNIPADGLDVGTHVGNYQAKDACGNISNSPFNIVVVDDIAPVTVCDQITDVSLDSDGYSVVFAETFDDGSHDNCGIESMSVRRMTDNCDILGNTSFGPSVTFCCEDIAASPIMVVFQVTDYAGNSNICMVEVYVEDKIAPITLTCPAPEAIDCDEYLADYAAAVTSGDYDVLEVFGVASFYDNCDYATTYDVDVDINTCAEGTITRTWTASDSNGSTTCTQVITVNHVNDWSAQFPADIAEECTDGALPSFGEPIIFDDECELIGVSYEDTQYDVVPDACYKIVREWSVINWCIFDQFGSDVFDNVQIGPRRYTDGGDGFITYDQIIKVTDNEAPTFTLAEIDGCIIDPTASGETCKKDIVLPFPTNMDDCSDEFKIDIDGDLGFFNDIQGAVTITDVDPGEYTVSYNVTDECGNFTAEDVTINVVDCKKPTPYCVNGIIIEIMQTGMIDIWASDLDAGSFDNCPGDLEIYFNNNPALTSMTFSCGELGTNTVELWVRDEAGNADFCVVDIFVQDNMGVCGDAAIAGIIETESAEAVADVELDLNGGLGSTTTSSAGFYGFDNLPLGGDFSVTPVLDNNHTNGVTTYDLVLISKHILGINTFDSPYEYIAADANNSGSVTTYDMVVLRRLILLIDTEFANNTSWRFVDAGYVFPSATNPWLETFPEVINYNNLNQPVNDADFVAIKIGDVNGSVSFAQNADERNTEAVILTADNTTVKAGESVTVAFNASDLNIEGFQFTLNHSNLELVEIIDGVATADNFGIKADALTASWNGTATEEVLFTAVFIATADVTLSEVMSINSRYTAAEAYNTSGETMDVVLTFKTLGGFELFQNSPNPFNDRTFVSFNLPTEAAATLTINDINGKVIYMVNVEGTKGYNSVEISDLAASGVLYYTLKSGDFTATKKMVIVK